MLILIVAILLAGLMLAFVAWRKRKEAAVGLFDYMNKKVFLIQLSAGIVLALLGAFFMWDGDILGENTTGIAQILGIVGIGLIASSPVSGRAPRRKSD